MSSLSDVLRDMDDKIEDLYRDTKFCLNNYDYHHKNNEYEVLNKMKCILDECAPDGKRFIKSMKKFKDTIDLARKKCSEVDDLLKELNIDPGNTGNSPSVGCSRSFIEDENATDAAGELDGNKENITK
ncbi:uncharacterized protein LOC142229514 [Haematobia irritans]|uniref:uncharacterized protein LOC142229514 n=1 Tax=Haematobia irritans TaxID=7368 RepID=UPI003F50C3B1